MSQLKTRLLETPGILRASVESARVLEENPDFLLLKTEAPVCRKKDISTADNQMLELERRQKDERDIREGRLRIDVLSDRVFRIRYR